MRNNLFLRISDEESTLLEAYCEATNRTKSDVVRELIRTLEPPKQKKPAKAS